MNQSFDLSRFGFVLQHHWAENGKRYLISFGLIVGLMVLLMLPIVSTSQRSGLLEVLHLLGLFSGVIVGASLFTSTAFVAYGRPEQGISAIMLPASQQEKFAVISLMHLLFAVLVFVAGYLLHHGLVGLANQNLSHEIYKYVIMPPEIIRLFGFLYFLLQGTLFLGSLYFAKNAFIKTLGILLIVTVLAFILNLLLAYQFTDAQRLMAFPFTPWTVFYDRPHTIYYPPLVSTSIRVFLGLIVVGFGYITFVRLQEKEM